MSESTYGWLITYDSIDNEPDMKTCGPYNLSAGMETKLRQAVRIGRDKYPGDDVEWFRMYDDDGELYYSGVRTGESDYEHGFEPLEDYGTPNAGCTRIDYYNPDTKTWETL